MTRVTVQAQLTPHCIIDRRASSWSTCVVVTPPNGSPLAHDTELFTINACTVKAHSLPLCSANSPLSPNFQSSLCMCVSLHAGCRRSRHRKVSESTMSVEQYTETPAEEPPVYLQFGVDNNIHVQGVERRH